MLQKMGLSLGLSFPLQAGKAQIDEQDKDEQHHSRGKEGLAVEVLA